MYAIINNGALVFGPESWDRAVFRTALLGLQSGFTPFLPVEAPTAPTSWEGSPLIVVPVTYVTPTIDRATQQLVVGAPVVGENSVTVTYGVEAIPAPAQATPAERCAHTIAAGLAITSTSTPALNGVYAIDDATQNKITSVSQYITVNGKFPAGLEAFPMHSPDGAKTYIFSSPTLYQAAASAICDYVAMLTMDSYGQAQAWPSQTATIS